MQGFAQLMAFIGTGRKIVSGLVTLRERGCFVHCVRNNKPFDHDVWNKQPCRRLRLESVVDHESSNGHKTAERLEIMTIEHEDLTANMNEMKKYLAVCISW